MTIDFKKAAEEIRATFKDKNKAESISIGSEMMNPSKPEDFVVMPEWFETVTGSLGIPFGAAFMIAGNTDSGKTSCAITAIKQAQEQGVVPILVDTEKKTTVDRLIDWDVNPDTLARIQPSTLEEAYDGIDLWIDKIKDMDPNAKILIVFDSLGNTPSAKESEINVEDTMQLGVAAKVNKRGARRLVPRLQKLKIAMLVINQTYNNLGSPGRSNAGGNAWDFYCQAIIQTSRKAWIEKQDKGQKVRKGATVLWTLYKNHLIKKGKDMRKSVEINITEDGMSLKGE